MKILLGEIATITKLFTKEEVNSYNKIILDSNPIHFDSDFAASTIFNKIIVPGLLVTSLFGGLLGSKLPGHGTILLGTNVKFLKPVFVDENVTASIEVINIRSDKPIITFSTICKNSKNETVIEGTSIVKIFDQN